jgi:short-subunit dehydrogenase
VYGATKAGIVQFSRSLQKEWKDSVVDMHVISPGMMPTDLLQDNIDAATLEKIAFLFTHPDLVAHHMVPRMKRAYFYHEDSYMRFLTLFKIIEKLLTQKQA